MIIRLVMTNGVINQWVELQGAKEYLIGREEAELIIDDPRCSRKHAVLSKNRNGKLVIRDLKSSNGTIVNKEKIDEVELKIDDVIKIGRSTLMVEEVDPNDGKKISTASIVVTPIREDERTPPPQKAEVNARALGSELLIGWPNNYRSIEKKALENFVFHLDEDQRKNSKRLLEILEKGKKKD